MNRTHEKFVIFYISSATPYAEIQVTRPTRNRKDFSVDTHKLGGEVKGLNPSWGEAVFCIENVEKDDLDKISVEITIKDRRSLGSVIYRVYQKNEPPSLLNFPGYMHARRLGHISFERWDL